MKKKLVNKTCLLLLVLSGCRVNTEIIPEQISNTLVDSIPISHIVEEQTKVFPLLVIENCGALWREHCSPDEYLANKTTIEKAYKFLGSDSIISIGSNGILNQEIEEVYCMMGECGENQVAFKLRNKECFGILTAKGFNKDSSIFSFMKYVNVNKLNQEINLTPEDSFIMNLELYSNKANNLLIQIGGKGYIQENDWPMYHRIMWRTIILDSNEYKINQWDSLDLHSTNLPKPIAVSSYNKLLKIIWYHGEGICCPSNSMAWVSIIDLLNSNEEKKGDSYPGGFGQPCD